MPGAAVAGRPEVGQLGLDAVRAQVSRTILPAAGCEGGAGSTLTAGVGGQDASRRSSDSWPAGQPVLPVNVRRTYLAVVMLKPTVVADAPKA